MATISKKDKFFEVLRNIFIGAKIEGTSGYVNLMKIKSKYYSEFKEQLQKDIDTKLKAVGKNFEEELYNKLFTFFKKYFSESGSIYFSYTPLQEKVYERIYRDDKDVMLFWKTHMLYYVKTERLFKNMDIEDADIMYSFDVTGLQHKKNNEKKNLVFELIKAEHSDKRRIYFSVNYSEKGRKTKSEEILKTIRKEQAFGSLNLKQIEKVFGIFKRQTEVDYFINKDAKGFLKEQFALWVKGYLLDDETLFEGERLKQLKALQQIAFNIIDLVGQFEDELVKIWNKPKFVHSSNYLITINKIAERNLQLLKTVLKHKGIKEQLREWQDLGLINSNFSVKEILTDDKLSPQWKYLPLDTRYFKDLEFEILGLFEDIDNQLNGWLIQSENYQALNSIKRKFQQKLDLIYIDPPFNTGTDFDYIDNYQDSSWLTIMNDRLMLSDLLLKPDGNFYLHLDENANYLGRLIADKVFGKESFKREIIWDIQVLSGYKVKGADKNWILGHQNILYYSKSKKQIFNKVIQGQTLKYLESFKHKDENGDWYQIAHGRKILKKDVEENGKPYGDVWKAIQDLIDVQRPFPDVWKELTELIDENKPFINVWDDIKSFQQQPTSNEKLKLDFETQKPEKLMERIIKSSSDAGGIILDYFLGSGSTVCTALKVENRKFIGIEMGDHFERIIIPRLKQDLFNGRRTVVAKENNYFGGGLIKYYALEQYEEALNKVKYEDKESLPTQDIYHQYLFLKDLKLAEDVVKLDEKSESIKVDLSKLHPNIDIAESLSLLTGKFIKQIKPDRVIFADDSEIEYANIDYKIAKPLIWW